MNRFRGLNLDQFPENIVDAGLRPTAELVRLDPAELVRDCKKAKVSLLTVWAKPQTGIAWYPTKVGTHHFSLKKIDYICNITDLAHRENIKVWTAYSLELDTLAAEIRPDWALSNHKGKPFVRFAKQKKGPNNTNLQGGATAIYVNSPYLEYALSQIWEIASNYPVDGIAINMLWWDAWCYFD